MDMSDVGIVESIDGGYPFGDHMDKLRENAGAFMRHVLSDDDDDMDDEPCVITPDYPSSFASSPASTPSEEQQIRPVARQPPSTEFQIQMMPDSKDKPVLLACQNAFGATSSFTSTRHQIHTQTFIERSSHQNHHSGSHTMTSTSRVPATMISRQRPSPIKKSRSIQIRKSRRGSSDEFASSSVSSSAEQMYDWATWRMYHRITTARRNKAAMAPLHQEREDTSESNARMFRSMVSFPLDGGESSPRKESTTTRTEQRNDFDEGIFVMDL
jgi:hypothetical protein